MQSNIGHLPKNILKCGVFSKCTNTRHKQVRIGPKIIDCVFIAMQIIVMHIDF